MENQVLSFKVIERDSVTLRLSEIPKTDIVYLSYHTLNSNHPSTNNNYIGLWESSDGSIPPNDRAIESRPIDINDTSRDGWETKFMLETKAYVFGYCLTGDPTDFKDASHKKICASASIPEAYKTLDDIELESMSLDIAAHGSSYHVAYVGLENIDYIDSWVGIWKASDLIDNVLPFCIMPVTTTGSEGDLKIPDKTLVRGTKYKMGFFLDGYDAAKKAITSRKSLTSLLTFQTD